MNNTTETQQKTNINNYGLAYPLNKQETPPGETNRNDFKCDDLPKVKEKTIRKNSSRKGSGLVLKYIDIPVNKWSYKMPVGCILLGFIMLGLAPIAGPGLTLLIFLGGVFTLAGFIQLYLYYKRNNPDEYSVKLADLDW